MIELEVLSCTRCSLHKQCNQIVPGNGQPSSPLLILNAGTDKEDDLMGEPLSGRAGQLFFKLLEQSGIDTKYIYITNMVKCAGPISDFSIKSCKYWVWQEIQLIKPKVIVTLGEHPTYLLLQNLKASFQMKDVVDKIHQVSYTEAKIMPWYHPNYLLNRGKAWDKKTIDFFKKVKEII